MLLSELLNEAAIKTCLSLPIIDVEISGICPDSSRVKPHNIFIAIKGLHADGHLFVSEALKNGASAIVVTSDAVENETVDLKNVGVPTVIVEDTRIASARLFAAWYGNPQKKLKMIGVTGTNGKTSTCRLIYEMLLRTGRKCALIGTMGSWVADERLDIRSCDPKANMTTPDPEQLYRILYEAERSGADIAIMEVTSHALSLGKVEPIYFEVAIFTNLSEDHLDFHADMESYFAAKEKLFSKCRYAIINYDDRYGRRLAKNIKIPMKLCSIEGRDTDSFAEDIRLLGERGIEYKLVSRDLRLRVRSPLSGSFNVMNTMQAALVAHGLGVSVTNLKEALANFGGIGGRLERLKLPSKCEFSVFIDYAHTPDALENLLRTARGFSREGQRLVLLFGCGGDRDRAKRPIMGKIATAMADYVIITSDNSRGENPRDIISEILLGVECESRATYTVIENRSEAIEHAIYNARRGDIILLAGKGHEEYEIDSFGKRPFSERTLVEKFVKKYYC